MDNVTPHRDPDDPQEIWQGVVAIDRDGATIGYNLVNELEWNDAQGNLVGFADLGCLEDWARQGRPFRNFVLESLVEARAAGVEAEAAFCAVLTDYISIVASGSIPDAGRYQRFYDIETE